MRGNSRFRIVPLSDRRTGGHSAEVDVDRREEAHGRRCRGRPDAHTASWTARGRRARDAHRHGGDYRCGGVDQAEIDAGALEAAATLSPAVQGGRIVTGSALAAGWPSVRVGIPASWSRSVRSRRRCFGTGAACGPGWHGPCPRRAFGMPIEESRFVRSHPPAPRRIGRPGRVRWGEPKAFQRLRATRDANPEARQP